MGSEGSVLEPHESASGILKVLTNLKNSDSGKFFRYDGGETPW